ncbi:MAG: DUF4153 domain-containing protein [Dermatophilaceae bacterium]
MTSRRAGAGAGVRATSARRERGNPLRNSTSLKTKLGGIVGLSVLVATVLATAGASSGVTAWLFIPVAVLAAMLVTQLLAAGMTAPLRAMTDAATRMAGGDYDTRVEVSGRDEVADLARAFTAMAGDLEAVDRHRRELIATVAHELRTPVAAIRAVAENLADGVTAPSQEALDGVVAQSDRLASLVENLLSLSRIDAGHAQLDLAPVQVALLLDAAVTEVRALGRQVDFAVEITPPDLVVQADPSRVRQILTNVLDNASRHSPAGTIVRIRGTGASSDRAVDPVGTPVGVRGPGRIGGPRPAPDSPYADRPVWTLDITDEGCGIAPADRVRVFERFGTASAGGTGLGLAIARWIAELHGGRLEAVDPAGGRGACLRLTLPLVPESRVGPPETAPSTPPMTRQAPATASHELATPTRPAPGGATGAPIPTPELPRPTTPGATVSASDPATTTRPAPRGVSTRHTIQDAATRPGPPPPTIDALFGALWPERDLPGRPRLLALAVGVGALAAVVVPHRNNGIGSTLVLAAVAGAVLVAARWRGLTTIVCAALLLGLILIPTLRAAAWLVPLVLLSGAVVLVVAVTPARSVSALIGEAVAWPLSGLRGLPWLGRSLRVGGSRRTWWTAARTLALSALAGGVFLALFASADAVLGSWIGALTPDLSIDGFILRAFLFGFVFGVTLAGVYLALNPIPDAALTLPPGRPTRVAWEWLVPVGLVIAAYGLFIAAQATAWLAGHDYVRRTTGLTYAEYVHQGFGQLTVASLLTLVVVAVAARKSRRTEPGDLRTRRLVLGTLCALTLVVVASALYRMHLYQQAYGYTTQRLVVDLFELWVGLVVVLVMVGGLTRDGRWVPRTAALTGSALILGLGLLNPEAWVTNRNIDRYLADGGHPLDTTYLSSLSADATPTIVRRLPERARDCSMTYPIWSDVGPDDALGWNLGRARARSALSGLTIDHRGTACTEFDVDETGLR